MLAHRVLPKRPLKSYDTWVAMFDTLHPEDRAAIRADAEALSYKPLLSVVMPVYNAPSEFLRQAVDSVLEQLYAHWELCIADDCSPDPEILRILATYQRKDSRIKVVRRDQNGNVSAASNSALALATGELVALMGHDDILPAHALYMVAVELNRYPEADIIYSDEDKIDRSNIRYGAYFKSDWNPDLMRGQNMINHLGVYRRSLLASIGGFRLGYEGSQDYDLALRAVERTTPERIRHIPHVLYHRRVFPQSGSFSASNLPRATRAARRAVQDHLDRLGTGASVVPLPGLESYSRVTYPLPAVPPPVTLIVPTRDKVELLSQCVNGLLERTDYPDFDVTIVDNGSCATETLAYFASLERKSRVKILAFDREFNYSAINNFAIGQARGNVIGLVNNDTKVIEPGWLKEMVSHALRPDVGAVGAKLLYPDDRVQHAGVITGINGVANHAHKFWARDDVGYFGRLVLTQDYSCVTAACLVMRKAVYEEVGGLDETNLPVSYNDVDLCLRIRDKRYLVVWTPHAELYHMESASRGPDTHPEQAERARNEGRYMKARWRESLLCDPYYNPNLSLDDVDFNLAFPPRGRMSSLKQLENQYEGAPKPPTWLRRFLSKVTELANGPRCRDTSSDAYPR
jgi:glycosyltransferase involved in cell wall biosynthesis